MATDDVTELTLERFEAAEIEPGEFSHAAHVYVGWLCLRKAGVGAGSGEDGAIARFDGGLRRLVTEFGAEEKYSAQVTWLFMKLIAARMREGETWEGFRGRNGDLFDGWPRG